MIQASSADSVRIVPLGGLGEIGANCLAIEQEDGILLVDCGTAFPHDDVGIDVLHPDFTWLLDRADRVSGLFLTHGHEDHIGAVPYLLSQLRVPIWGPPHAMGLVQHRLQERELDIRRFELNEAFAGQRYQVGPFEVEPIRVAHSIVEATALAVRTRAGTIIHTGDFNLDADPPDGEPTNEARLQQLGDEGVRLLLSDSTNIDVEQRPGSEREVGASLEQLISGASGRVFVVMFASNIQRLMLLGGVAERTGRKLCLLGRSLQNHVEVCRQIGRLRWPSNLVVSVEQALELPRDQVILLSGGSQAERNSAMRRVASGSHPLAKVEPGDSVILSSRIIPGNERQVFEMVCDLLRIGAQVHTRFTDPGIHTSGHAGRSEQRRMMELVRPRSFVPVHGTLHHLLRHAELARSVGIGDVMVVENGSTVRVNGSGLESGGDVPHGKVPIAFGGQAMAAETVRRRAELGRSGLVAVSVVISDRQEIVAGPEVVARGVPSVDDEPPALRAIARDVAVQFERVRHWHNVDLKDELRRAARRRVLDLCGCRPNIEVQLHRVR